MTEFIENPEDLAAGDKQDCELKAFKRLAKRLEKRFPHLPICLLLDGLFANGPSMTICEENRWKYITVLKDADLKNLHRSFEVAWGAHKEKTRQCWLAKAQKLLKNIVGKTKSGTKIAKIKSIIPIMPNVWKKKRMEQKPNISG